MASVLTSATQISKLVPIYYDRVFLERLESNRILVFHQFGVKKNLPKKQGETIYWHSWRALAKAKMITESSGTHPQYQGISARRVSANLLMIGDHARITTYVDMVAINSVVEGAVELFGEQAAWSVDYIVSRSILWKPVSLSARFGSTANSGTLGNANYLSGGLGGTLTALKISSAIWQFPLYRIDNMTTRNLKLSGCPGGNSGTLFTPATFRWAKLKLKVKMARPFPNGHYKAIMHPDMIEQLRGSSAYIDLHKYTTSDFVDQGTLAGGGGKNVRPENGLEGYLEGFDIYSTTEAPMVSVTNGATGASANGNGRFYFNLFFGQGAYGVTDFNGGVQTFIKTPGPQDTSQPLNLYSTVGFKAILAAQVLNNSAGLWILQGKPTIYG